MIIKISSKGLMKKGHLNYVLKQEKKKRSLPGNEVV